MLRHIWHRRGELGPGDSIGAGLAALLSGADRYVGLDVMPFLARADLEKIFDELVQNKIERIRRELRAGVNSGQMLYLPGTLDFDRRYYRGLA
jgi:hypothetical protein